MYRISAKPRRSIKPLLIIGGVVLVLLVGLGALEFSGATHLIRKNTAPVQPSASQNTKGESNDTSAQSANPTTVADSKNADGNSTIAGDNKSTSGGGSTAILIAPSGNFVSAHKNIPLSAPLSSVCNTTAGATCVITFTSGSISKSLSSQNADRGGTAYWNSWKPSDIGLTPGTWDVQATATLGSKTETAHDALKLEVIQ